MKIRILIFVGLLGFSVISPSNAGFYSGARMLKICESKSASDVGFCNGYLVGIADVHTTLREWKMMPDRLFCLPEGVPLDVLLKVLVKYANENPEKLHWAASSLAVNAFAGAFPCE